MSTGSLFAGEVLGDDFEEFGAGADAGDVGSEEAGAVFALGVVAAELAHEECAFFLAEALTAELVVPEHAGALLFEGGLGGNGIAAEGGGGLGEEPGAAEGGAGD